MYYPYLRGKQFELLALRECAKISPSGFVPIIEPVRQPLNRLKQTLADLSEADTDAVVIANPKYGDYRDNKDGIANLMTELPQGKSKLYFGILLTSEITEDEIKSLVATYDHHNIVLVHYGFKNWRYLTEDTEINNNIDYNIFIEKSSGSLYRKHYFDSNELILIRDGFQRRNNAEYKDPNVERFSDLHVTYRDYKMSGYGDFLTIGDAYSEGGGPAYAVAIHLTYIDSDQDDEMFVQHFVSDTNDTPTDPARKFAEALQKLVEKLDCNDSCFEETAAVAEFRKLHEGKHFPGLGYVKKLSIMHHIETLAKYESEKGNVNA